MMASNNSDNISASKRKRLEAEAQRKKAKQEAFRLRLTGILIGLAVLAVIVFWLIIPNAKNAYIRSHLTQPSDDYSAQLNEDGTIQDVDVTKTVTVFDPAEAIVEVTEVDQTDVQADIDSELNNHKTLETDKKLTVKDGDEINLDYVGKIDGKAFEGGSTDGAGADLTIGSGSYIDNFEEQLIGSHPGDKVTVKVTFPEDYQSEDLAGKEAEFACTVNGIYSVPEFNDKFVEENLADYAEGYKNTAEDYRRYLTDTKFDQNL